MSESIFQDNYADALLSLAKGYFYLFASNFTRNVINNNSMIVAQETIGMNTINWKIDKTAGEDFMKVINSYFGNNTVYSGQG